MYNIFYCIFISLIFTAILFITNTLIVKYRQKGLSKFNLSNYECGVNNNENPYYIHEFKFFLIAIIFLIFEVEVIFLLPFITIFKTNNLTVVDDKFQNFIFIEMFIFICVLALGLIYAIKRKYLHSILTQ
ncbi:MAG: NADH-quinone oxidoreductase subunit A [Solitalea-like symbiont of Acarus siro]